MDPIGNESLQSSQGHNSIEGNPSALRDRAKHQVLNYLLWRLELKWIHGVNKIHIHIAIDGPIPMFEKLHKEMNTISLVLK